MSGFIATPVNTIVRYDVGSTPQSSFVVPFPFDDLGDLLVTVNDVPQIVTLSGTTEVEGFFTAANVVLAAPVSNVVVYVQRRTQLEQEVKYAEAGAFRTRPLNAEISRLWMALQDTRRELDFSLGVVLGTDTTWTPNALVDTITNVILDKLLPPGVVIGWAGFESDIPDGWEIHEPMRDKFIVAAGPTRPNNSTGGADLRSSAPGGGNAGGVTGGRSLTVAQLPPHDHPYQVAVVTTFGAGGGATRTTELAGAVTGQTGSGAAHDHPLPAVPDHQHEVVVVPVYYAQIFLIRVGLVVAFPPGLELTVTGVPASTLFRAIHFAASDETSPIAVATNLIETPATTTLTATKVKVSLRTASSSGTVQINVRINGVVMTAAPISLGVGVKVVNATVLAVTQVVEDALITVDVVAAGTGARGLKVAIIGRGAP